jgi:prophage antirepressor-like protein
MNQLQIFKNSDFGEIRTVTIDNEPWFVATDVCRALEIKNATDAVKRLDEDEVTRFNLGGLSGESNCVNEYGLYNLVLGSRKPEAKQFKRWITHEVIPQIRKTGSYIPDASALSPELQLMNALVAQMNQEALSRIKLESEMKETREEIQEIREVVEIKPFDNWREDTNSLINKICKKTGDYKDTRHRIYDALNQRARVDIKRRLDNMKARAIVAGMQRSKADALTYLDVIAEDKKLIEIYTAIVKEMAIKKGVQ